MPERVISYEGSGGEFDARLVDPQVTGHIIRAAFNDYENPEFVYANLDQDQQGLDLTPAEIDELTSIE